MTTRSQLIAAAVAAVLVFFAGWTAQGWRADKKIAEIEKANAVSLAKANAQALDRYKTMEAQKDEAIQAHAKLVAENAAFAATAKRTVDSLQRDLATMPRRIAAASEASVREYATTASELLGACAAEYQSVAEQADKHAADVRLMRDSWPQN